MSSRKWTFLEEKVERGKRIYVKEFPGGRLLMTGLDFDFRRYNYSHTNDLIRHFGWSREQIAKTRQKHTKHIIVHPTPGEYVGVDGFVGDKRPLMIVTADCIPLFLRTKKDDVVALLHAGWKGVQQRIYMEAIPHFKKKGILTKDIECYMLPSISCQDFEVRGDFVEAFSGRKNFSRFLKKKSKETFVFDLKKFVKSELLDLGFQQKHIFVEEHSTLHSDRFHSYRGEGENYGLNAIFYFPKGCKEEE